MTLSQLMFFGSCAIFLITVLAAFLLFMTDTTWLIRCSFCYSVGNTAISLDCHMINISSCSNTKAALVDFYMFTLSPPPVLVGNNHLPSPSPLTPLTALVALLLCFSLLYRLLWSPLLWVPFVFDLNSENEGTNYHFRKTSFHFCSYYQWFRTLHTKLSMPLSSLVLKWCLV